MQRKHRLVQFYRSRCPREVGDEVMEVTSRFLDVATGRGNRGSVPGSARAPSGAHAASGKLPQGDFDRARPGCRCASMRHSRRAGPFARCPWLSTQLGFFFSA